MACAVGRRVEKLRLRQVLPVQDRREVFGFGNSMVGVASEAALRDHPYDGPDSAVEQVSDNRGQQEEHDDRHRAACHAAGFTASFGIARTGEHRETPVA